MFQPQLSNHHLRLPCQHHHRILQYGYVRILKDPSHFIINLYIIQQSFDGIPEVIGCMKKSCQRQQTFEAVECLMMDFSNECDVCGDVPCPTAVIPGPTLCHTFVCKAKDSPCQSYITAVPILGGNK